MKTEKNGKKEDFNVKERDIKINESDKDDDTNSLDENLEDVNTDEKRSDEELQSELNAEENLKFEKTAEQEIVELKEQILRKTAELENMRRRVLKEKNELIQYANHTLLAKLLPLMDDFEKAIEAGKEGKDSKSLLQGIELIHNKAVRIFEDSGVKKMEVNPGDEFDVDFHEALMQMNSDDIEEGKVVQVAQEGYMFNDKVLRHAKVIVSSGPSDENKEE